VRARRYVQRDRSTRRSAVRDHVGEVLLAAALGIPRREHHVDDVVLDLLVDGVYVDDKVKEYVIDLVQASRNPQAFRLELSGLIEYGASPRATLYLVLAAKAHAFLAGRGYVTPQDVKSIGADVLRHRVIPSYEAEAEDLNSDEIVRRIFDGVPVP
jgi:MoxR-like ATPase